MGQTLEALHAPDPRARLRHQRFFSLGALNRAIAALLQDLNQRPFKKLPGCRASALASLDQPVLKPLPASRMPIARFKVARVNIDYHVELDGHYYSVPHRLVGEMMELRITVTTVEVLHGQTLFHARTPSWRTPWLRMDQRSSKCVATLTTPWPWRLPDSRSPS